MNRHNRMKTEKSICGYQVDINFWSRISQSTLVKLVHRLSCTPPMYPHPDTCLTYIQIASNADGSVTGPAGMRSQSSDCLHLTGLSTALHHICSLVILISHKNHTGLKFCTKQSIFLNLVQPHLSLIFFHVSSWRTKIEQVKNSSPEQLWHHWWNHVWNLMSSHLTWLNICHHFN